MTGRTGTLYWLPAILADDTLDPTETLLMIGLADHVDEADQCFVSITTLAKYARVSYPTACRRLENLVTKGRLSRTRRRRDDGNLSTYLWALVRPEPVINLTTDQSSPGRQLTSHHPGDDAEVPSVEVPSVEENMLSQDLAVARTHPTAYPDGFDAFWRAYPVKKWKAKASTAWKAAVRKAPSAAIISAAEAYANDPRRDPDYTKNPAAWLEEEGWLNEPPKAKPNISKATLANLAWAERTS